MAELTAEQVAAWRDYASTPWGRLRLDVLWTALERHVPRPQRVLDVGCGTGELAVRFALAGSEVVVADATSAMVDAAQALARENAVELRGEVARVEETERAFAGERFDLVLCHNVLSYVADPAAACAALAALGGAVSVAVGNRLAEPLRAAFMRHDLTAALASVGSHARLGETLAVEIELHEPDQLRSWLEEAGLRVVGEAGIRVVSDYLYDANDLKAEHYDELLALELALCEREPYRRIAPFLLAIGTA